MERRVTTTKKIARNGMRVEQVSVSQLLDVAMGKVELALLEIQEQLKKTWEVQMIVYENRE